MLKALTNATIFTGSGVITGRSLLLDNDLISGIINNDSIPDDAEIIDCRGNSVASGFIDLQIAGGGGLLFSSYPTPEAINTIADSITSTGTTTFLLVLPTNTFEVYYKSIEAVRKNPHPALYGLHLEGPYISHTRRGAHMSELIRRPDAGEISKLLEEGRGVIKMVTLAPEECKAEIIELFRKYDIVVCAGHSNATFSEAMEGFRSGVQSVTHLFNAMSPFHHRSPGLPGAAFQSESACASIVADGIHVDYHTLAVAKRLMKERLFLVSDAVEENNIGAYHHVRQKDRFTLPDGTLSGSALTMMKAVQNCIEHAGIETDEAIRMGTLYPAKLMGMTDRGKIEAGCIADLVIFDTRFEVISVYKNGNCI